MKIIFDESSRHWEQNFDWNILFVKTQMRYFQDLYRVRGYLYLNTIYECLGLAWNPEKENKCWIYKKNGDLKMGLGSNATTLSLVLHISEN